MTEAFHYRQLRPVDLTEMYLAFLSAFSDYPIEFKLTKEQFVRKFVEKLKIDFSLSVGTYQGDALCGFIFSSVNYYKGKLTAYNGGTGVRPAYRGRKLTNLMYEFLIPLLKRKNVKQCVLEVLTENYRAIKAYESIGFEKTKAFQCFRLPAGYKISKPVELPLDVFEVEQPSWHIYEQCSSYEPSFLDSKLMVSQNLANETIIEAHFDGKCIGYAIFQPLFGRISQIGVNPDFRHKGVGSTLIAYAYQYSKQQVLTVINIDETATETLSFFKSLGFKNEINQYEMILPLQ